jgi:hypothetical protein
MPFRWRVVIGFTLAPVVSFAAFTVWIVLSSLVHIDPIQKQSASSLLEAALELRNAVLVVASLSTVLVGIPMFFWQMHRRRFSLSSTLIAGLIVGTAPFLGILVAGFSASLVKGLFSRDFWSFGQMVQGAPLAFWWLLLLAFCGVASSCVFWLLALRGKLTGRIGADNAAA